eukprot:13596989-Ditylum_brightwellii.AAC.1
MSTFSTKEVKSKFLNKTISCVDGESTYEHIHTIMMELYGNAGAVPTILGGRTHGHIGLVVDTVLYETLSTTVYVVPTQPTRSNFPPRDTVVHQETMKCQYKLEKAIYDNHNMVEETVKT